MPRELFGTDHPFLPKVQLLTFEEIARTAHIFSNLGTHKIRLTGGEPLIRTDVEKLISMLKEIPGIDLAMTTNGSFPTYRVQTLKDAGLDRITVSLDSLDNEVFQAMNDSKFPVERVLDWIAACENAGFNPVKVNMVVKRGVNEGSILPMALYFRALGHTLRFIEFMDVGSTNGWRMDDVFPANEIISMISAEIPIEPVAPNYPGEVAQRCRYKDGSGEIGIISSVTQAFCQSCTRMRLSADGKIYTCLFAINGFDLRELLRSGANDTEIAQAVTQVWQKRTDRYSDIRSQATTNLPKVEMSYIGG